MTNIGKDEMGEIYRSTHYFD